MQINEGDICIDCGANVGIITKKLLKKGALVYSFEPNPFAFEKLLENCKGLPNLVPIQQGVGAKQGTFRLFLHHESKQDQIKWSTGSSFLEEKNNVDSSNFIEVKTTRLSDFILNLNKEINILKIDIEGLEYEVLEDIIKTEAIQKIKHVLVETHEHKIPSLAPISKRVRTMIKEKGITNINLEWL
ncbi:MAG: FkbM family methyltransferase [Bacteriovoracaceae bacterium]|nr:FkbM family methyltransferase [Bacteriovoracaceae bacterium]